jgi:hypothetical protein
MAAVQYYTAEYNAIAGFENLRYLNQFEVPCAVCVSDRTQGFTTWGSNTCPAGTSTQYGGLIMSDRVLRTSFECVEKRHPEPARGPCSYCLKADGTEDAAKTTESSCEAVAGNVWTPRHRCLASKVPMSFASFRANDDEWVDATRGSLVTSAGAGWVWINKVVASDAHSGVLHRVTDTGTASISTPCTFDRTNISVQLDVLPRKHTQASTRRT